MQLSAVLFALAAASGAYAHDQLVAVGDNGTLSFSPQSVGDLKVGDSVIFEFRAKNHSVTQSSFTTPCSPLPNGFNTDFVPVNTTTSPFPRHTYNVTNASAPLWFYCAQTSPVVHCNSGMVFAINPTTDKNFTAFQAAANASSSTSTAPSGTSTSPVAPTNNGVARMSASASSILALAGLVAGLMF